VRGNHRGKGQCVITIDDLGFRIRTTRCVKKEKAPMSDRQWWDAVFASIDGRQTHAFVAFLCEDGVFRYGSNPDVHGRTAITSFVDQVFSTFRASAHELERCWDVNDCRIAQGIVTYTRLDNAKVSLPFCNVLTMRGGLAARYEIFVDPTPLFRPVSADEALTVSR
jgi:ketosteroid isomerase-like protein